MTAMLDAVGPAIWRASWQAAALALLVALLVRCFGERLSPRWRFLLWGVVLTRFLVVATPTSPWSVFNLAPRNPQAVEWPTAWRAGEAGFASTPRHADPGADGGEPKGQLPRPAGPAPESLPARASVPAESPSAAPWPAVASTPPAESRLDAALVGRVLSAVWLAGCLLFGLRLLATAVVLRRRLSACRLVADADLLNLLESFRRRFRLKHTPALLVTPECLSPCVVGTWNPRIVLPEAVVTQSSDARLCHVLAHELAHLARGDLWTNWLLLAARVLHWFNPAAWWTARAMQAEREAACDDLASAVLGEADPSAYAATIVELAATLAPNAVAPGLVGLFSSTSRLTARVERLVRSPAVKTLRAPVAAGLIIGTALTGLTDAMPGARAQAPKQAAAAGREGRTGNVHTVSGRCVNHDDGSPLAGVEVRLYRAEGRTSPPVEVAKAVTGPDGRYAFLGLTPPRPDQHVERLNYAVFGLVAGRPVAASFMSFRGGEAVAELRVAVEQSVLSGRVIDAGGRPVAGATVVQHGVDGRPVAGVLSATTDAQGRFLIDNVGLYRSPDGKPHGVRFTVVHPDHPAATGEAAALPANVVVTLPAGCVVTGVVTDAVAGGSAAGAVITARRVDQWGETFAETDAAGRFRLVVPEGRYNFLADAKDRVCVATTGRDCPANDKVAVPPLTLTGGGFIAGRVVNTATGQPVAVTESGEPVMLGLIGPSQPVGWGISPARLAAADTAGRFVLRAAPGANYPYLVNTRGERMAWDTQRQPPVVVKEGETTAYDMLITPEVPPEEKLKAARKLVAALPKQPAERTAQILHEFRKLNHTVDETELWCLVMRELVAVGRDAVPQLCTELDRTIENRMLRRLGFALRAIGDARAVPALVRAVPKTLLPASSDYGLIVNDPELTAFMQEHDLRPGKGGRHFDLGRPVSEVFGALHALTGQNLDDAELFGMHLSDDPRRQVLQRRIYRRQAGRWQEWWEANWRRFTDDAAYQKCHLAVGDEPLPPAPPALGKTARLSGELSGAVLSPAAQGGQHARHFYDLDTGYQPLWPARIPRDEASHDGNQLAEWESQSGVDLTCVTHRSPDGAETYVLRALGMRVREIDARDARNLDRLVAAGTLPEGRPVGELLMHYDTGSRQYVPDANAAFIYVTRDGSMGVIETTDRITRTADLTGMAGGPPAGVGFHKGVRFNLKAIIP